MTEIENNFKKNKMVKLNVLQTIFLKSDNLNTVRKLIKMFAVFKMIFKNISRCLKQWNLSKRSRALL